jgi:hypothetical protein
VRLFGRLWQTANAQPVLAGVVTAAILAAGSGAFALIKGLGGDEDSGPVLVNVSGSPTSASFVVAVPQNPPDVSGWERVGQHDDGVLAWLREVDGAWPDQIERRIVLVGGSDSTVITDMRVRVVDNLPPAAAMVDYLTPKGANAFGEVVDALADVGSQNTVFKRTNGAGPSSEPLFDDQTLSLMPGESQTFDLAMTGCDCSFVIELEVVSGGEQEMVEIRDTDGKPFRLVETDDSVPVWKYGPCDDGTTGLAGPGGECVLVPPES